MVRKPEVMTPRAISSVLPVIRRESASGVVYFDEHRVAIWTKSKVVDFGQTSRTKRRFVNVHFCVVAMREKR